MPEGAVLHNTVEAVLHDLAGSTATGCLVVRDQEGDEAEVYLRDGNVYAVIVPGRRVMLGVRLMSRGALTPEALAEALEIQRTELQGWRLGELLVHLGYVELEVVEEFVVEHVKDALADLMGWPVTAWKFRKNKKTRQDVAPPMSVDVLLDELRERATTWEQILAAIGGPECVPVLASGPPSDTVALGPNEWALLCKVDGDRSVADLAADCGFTLFEAGQVVTRLVEAGLVSTWDDSPEDDPEVEPADEPGRELVLHLVPLPDLEARESEQAEAELRELEQVERQQVEADAWAEHAEWLAAARAAAEADAWAEHAQWLAAARAADEDEAYTLHEQWLAEQAETERLAAEAAQRRADEDEAYTLHEQWLAEQAETERLAAEAAAEAERLAAEEARRAAEAAELAAAEERERAAREAAREAAEQAERDRLAHEKLEAERLAAARQAAREQAEQELKLEAERRAKAAEEAAAAEERARAAEAERAAAAEAERIAREAAEIHEQEAALQAEAALEAERRHLEEEVANSASLAAQAASMLTELTRDLPFEREPVPAPEPEPEPEPAPTAHEDRPAAGFVEMPMVERDHADTAMLLRELSSLGLDDEPRPTSPASPPVVRPVPAQHDPKKKRKGFFGR